MKSCFVGGNDLRAYVVVVNSIQHGSYHPVGPGSNGLPMGPQYGPVASLKGSEAWAPAVLYVAYRVL